MCRQMDRVAVVQLIVLLYCLPSDTLVEDVGPVRPVVNV